MTEECEDCAAVLITWPKWQEMSLEERERMRLNGYARKAVNTLCTKCDYRRRVGLPASKSSPRSRSSVLEEWGALADHYAPVRVECRRLAPRMGMTPEALERALHRAGVRSLINQRRAA